MRIPKKSVVLACLAATVALQAQELKHVQQRIQSGIIEGVVSADGKVRTFKGIPYAEPPVGALRWKAPQPVKPWTGVRAAVDFGPRAMQGRIYDDMVFHDSGPSEDCLYLNLWLPEDQPHKNLPVMVWIHGGGFAAGASSEPRQDGGQLCKKGVIVVSMNYRLGVFGFLALPELSQESPQHAAGNYGLMDQIAALQWVHDNIAAFGGDPSNVTIFGESAGSMSVSALMASPLAQGLFHKAIGESGAVTNTKYLKSKADLEAADVAFAEKAFHTTSLEALRAVPAADLLAAALKEPHDKFTVAVDGAVLPARGEEIFVAGKQAHVPLLAGWNRDEGSSDELLKKDPPTLENFRQHAKERFGEKADAFLAAYAPDDDAQVKRVAADFGGDHFIAYATWKWIDLHRQTGGSPVYRYRFDETLPFAKDAAPGTESVAPHASDIEYVFGMLASRDVPWTDEHRQVSEWMSSYWTNFAKTGNPNGPGLPAWPEYTKAAGDPVLHIKVPPVVERDPHRARYEFLDHVWQQD